MNVSLAQQISLAHLIEIEPTPEMATVEVKQVIEEQGINLNQFQASKLSLNNNLCNIEQVIFQHIYDGNIEKLKDLKIYMRDLNFLDEFSEEQIDKQIFPLALAVATGSIEVIKLLLSNEAIDINKTTQPQGLTCLKIACSNGYYEVAELLVLQGADVNQQNEQGSVPLFYCFSRLEEASNYFENKFLCFKLAELLIDNGADIDSIVFADKSYTLLMMFCCVKQKLSSKDLQVNLDVIRFLLEHGANRDRKTSKQRSIMELCRRHPANEQVVKMLNQIKPNEDSQLVTKKFSFKPQFINQKQTILMEGRSNVNNCCCSIMASSRNISKTPQQSKQWWNIF